LFLGSFAGGLELPRSSLHRALELRDCLSIASLLYALPRWHEHWLDDSRPAHLPQELPEPGWRHCRGSANVYQREKKVTVRKQGPALSPLYAEP
jgi:hypothetical protein